MYPDASLILAKEAASEAWTLLRQTSRALLTPNLRWVAENWVGVGLALKKDSNGNYLDELALTFSFAAPLPFPEFELSAEIGAFLPGLTDTSFAVEVTGPYKPLNAVPEAVQISPLSIGVALLPPEAGTLGAIVRRDASPGEWLMLSNNHVLYRNGDVFQGGARPRVCMPSPLFDSHIQRNAMGTVREMPPACKLQFPPAKNVGDYAIADIDDQNRVLAVPRPALRQPVSASGIANVRVRKVGAATGATEGLVSAIRHDCTLNYPTLGAFDFKDQIVIVGHEFSAGGDSGSLVSTAAGEPAAVLFAGNQATSLASPLSNLFASLGLSFVLPGEL